MFQLYLWEESPRAQKDKFWQALRDRVLEIIEAFSMREGRLGGTKGLQALKVLQALMMITGANSLSTSVAYWYSSLTELQELFA